MSSQIPRPKAVVTLSGGLDSTVAAFIAQETMDLVLGITFDYGQVAMRRELGAGYALAARLGIPHRVIQLPFFRGFESSALLNRRVVIPQVDPASLDDRKGVARQTAQAVWVPNRNGVFVAVAGAFAENLGAEYLVVGFNAEEAATFPDNSMAFVQAQSVAFSYSTANQLKLLAPTGEWAKKEIVEWAMAHDVPLEWCWPCYADPDEAKPCGCCESCRRFERAVRLAGAEDWLRERRKGR